MAINTTQPKDWAGKQVFSTGEAAVVCNLSQQTIIRCFDNGRLQGFRVPGSRFRRIPRAALIIFMHENNLPTDALEDLRHRVLVLVAHSDVAAALQHAVIGLGHIDIRVACDAYDAGRLTSDFSPHVVLMDHAFPGLEPTRVLQGISACDEGPVARLVLFSSNGVIGSPLPHSVCETIVPGPFDARRVIDTIGKLTTP
jgi:excisionase family DNA binding protein